MFRFEKLEVWQKADENAARIYQITCQFPDSERYGLTGQMRRSAVSISSNIAEGSRRTSDVGFARFLEIAYGSLMETVSQSRIASLQGFIQQQEYDELDRESERLARMLSGLRSSLIRRAADRTVTSGPRPSTLVP